MNITHLRRARRLFAHEGVPRSTVRHNIRAWVRSVRNLGSSWLLAKSLSTEFLAEAEKQTQRRMS